jgi:hypothetical protein
MGFSDAKETQLLTLRMAPGEWYIHIEGDMYGVVGGSVLVNNNHNEYEVVEMSPPLDTCKVSFPLAFPIGST